MHGTHAFHVTIPFNTSVVKNVDMPKQLFLNVCLMLEFFFLTLEQYRLSVYVITKMSLLLVFQ